VRLFVRKHGQQLLRTQKAANRKAGSLFLLGGASQFVSAVHTPLLQTQFFREFPIAQEFLGAAQLLPDVELFNLIAKI
jgi:hypothetical protein